MSQNQNNQQQSPKDLITGIVSIIVAIVFVVMAYSSCNGDSSSSSSSSSSSRSKCAFKQNGRQVCNNRAKSGSAFCSYHQNYLDDAYNTFFGN